jgi:hypothetical protein
MREDEKMISFDVARDEVLTIHAIAKRAATLIGGDLLEWDMDISATHANGSPLRLAELAEADDLNFVHDLCGIRKHLNRETGHLEDGFVPRFAQ